MKPIEVAISCDDRFAQHAAVTLVSVLQNSALPHQIRFWILTPGLTEENQRRLDSVVTSRGAAAKFLSVQLDRLKGFRVDKHITLASYLRIFLPELLPESVTRVVYLDTDLLMLGRVEDLYDSDLEGRPVAAVENSFYCLWDKLGFKPEEGYFNSGVLVIDLDQWRTLQAQEKLLELAYTHREALVYHDQDALNLFFARQWKRLPGPWNQQYNMVLNPGLVSPGFTEVEYKEALRHPRVVHFCGGSKPWMFFDNHPYRKRYYTYLDVTPYAGWRPKVRSTIELVKWFAFRIIPLRYKNAVFGY